MALLVKASDQVIYEVMFYAAFYTVRLYWAGTTWGNEMIFVMNHAPSAGSISLDLLTSSKVRYQCTTGTPTLDQIKSC